ncbi:MAG: ABC transporter permease subunit [Rhodanobacter sp.]|nr:MAG: ABC transporter permease subunit [Rhodanobacter sp.]TAM04524.1 MAG: ABC transporter permease subunit [Rhodanobacter sp.]
MRRALAWILSGMLVLPLVLLVLLSLARHWTWPALLPADLQLRQWRDLFADANGLGTVVLRSLGMGIGVAVAATALGFASSRSLARHARQGRLLALLHLPFAVSPVVLGVSLLYAFLRLHLAGHLLGVMLAQLVFAYAYAVILLSGFWNPRARSLEELASSLGAGRRQVWLHVLMPLARPLLGVCLFQTFLISWFDYALVLLIGSGQVATLTITLYQYFSSGDIRLAATCALLLLAPPLLALGLNQQLLSATIVTHLEAHDDD